MQSLIKRDVSLSITAHAELIRQLILDGLEVAVFRGETYAPKGIHRLKSDAIYYRNMRQNGHSTALRTIFNSPEFEDIDVMSVFFDSTQVKSFSASCVKSGSNVRPSQLISDAVIQRNTECLRGHKCDVLILNDYLSIGETQRGWRAVDIITEQIHDIKLVVFLG